VSSVLLLRDDLRDIVEKNLGHGGILHYSSQRHASIKDIIESLGVPHTEVGRIVANGMEVSFSYLLEDEGHVEIFPLPCPVDLTVPTLLRPVPLKEIRFAVDVNVAKLAMFLRMAGFDVFYENPADDKELARISHDEKRILLTRDKKLLKRKIIQFGHLVRTSAPEEQFREVIRLYDLKDKTRPFSRCLLCNTLLKPISKDEVFHRIEPLTKKYYSNFYICSECDKIYWPGSHKSRMEETIKKCLEGSA
jgi:uncharacterized protein with PIN domain